MQILQQGIAQHIVIRSGFDDCRYRLQTGNLRSTPTTLAHDELVHAVHAGLEHIMGLRRILCALLRLFTLFLTCGLDLLAWALTHNDWLKHADFLNGVSQLTQIILIKDGAWLMQIRTNVTEP